MTDFSHRKHNINKSLALSAHAAAKKAIEKKARELL